MNSSTLSRINEAISLLFEIKSIFRKTTPNYSIDQKQTQIIKEKLGKLNAILTELNKTFNIKQDQTTKISPDLKNGMNAVFLIVSSSKNRKKLLNLGFTQPQIISTGGPLTIDDLKSLNPHINESNIKNFETKIEKFWKSLQLKLDQGSFNKVILVLEEKSKIDTILLNNKELFEQKLSITFQILTLESLNNLEPKLLSFLNTET